ncbi:hypothetical protein OG885_14110 [Streptomyces sp. NBC_00028]|uniref:hypothetical protein n=1 Tax=Streptomyces sp. NBC_00028 TaxID=2975624 RepID=UPI00324BC070
MLRRRVGVVGAVVGALLLSGCGAEVLPLVAVRLDAAGTAEAVLRPCGDDLVQGLSLSGTTAGEADSDSARDRSGWRAPGRLRPDDAEFPLFSPPGDWHVSPAGEQRLVPGYTYELAFGKAEFNYEYTGIVTFTADDLSALRPGQVWADGRPMSLGEFEGLAEDSC